MFGFDKQFLYKLIEKDAVAFEEFYNVSVDIFFRYIKVNYIFEDSQIHDILSDFYIKYWNNLGKLNIKNNPSSYTWTVLKNTIIDHIKDNKIVSFTDLSTESLDFEGSIIDNWYDITEIVDIEFQSEQIKQAIEKIDDNYKDVLFMKYILHYENNQISEDLDISEDNVRQRLHRWLLKLKKTLEHLWDEQ